METSPLSTLHPLEIEQRQKAADYAKWDRRTAHPKLDRIRMDEELTFGELRRCLKSPAIKGCRVAVTLMFGQEPTLIETTKAALLKGTPAGDEWHDWTSSFLIYSHEPEWITQAV